MGGYFPNINVKTSEIDKYNITDYNNLKEVKQKIYDYYKNNYNNTNSTANYYYLEHPITIDGNKIYGKYGYKKSPKL